MRRDYYQPPPPTNLLGEGPISIRHITKNGNRVFDMLRGLHKEMQFMDSNHVKMDSKDADWIPISRKTNRIGKMMEEKLNGYNQEEDMYYDSRSVNTVSQSDIMNYQSVNAEDDTYAVQTQQYYNQSPQIIPNYKNNFNPDSNKTMSKNEDVDISEYIGGTSPMGDSFDKTIFINMDKTNKAILTNTTKICKLLGLLVQVENKNGTKIDKIVEYLNSKFNDEYPEDIEEEDENLTEVE